MWNRGKEEKGHYPITGHLLVKKYFAVQGSLQLQSFDGTLKKIKVDINTKHTSIYMR